MIKKIIIVFVIIALVLSSVPVLFSLLLYKKYEFDDNVTAKSSLLAFYNPRDKNNYGLIAESFNINGRDNLLKKPELSVYNYNKNIFRLQSNIVNNNLKIDISKIILVSFMNVLGTGSGEFFVEKPYSNTSYYVDSLECRTVNYEGKNIIQLLLRAKPFFGNSEQEWVLQKNQSCSLDNLPKGVYYIDYWRVNSGKDYPNNLPPTYWLDIVEIK